MLAAVSAHAQAPPGRHEPRPRPGPAARARLTAAAPGARLHLRQITWNDPPEDCATTDPTAPDAAFLWLPLPEPHWYDWVTVALDAAIAVVVLALAASLPLGALGAPPRPRPGWLPP